MGRGIALNDTDRGPWLEILATNQTVDVEPSPEAIINTLLDRFAKL